MRIREVKDHVTRAMARVEKNDRHLLMIDVSERSIAARLAMYLSERFKGHDVDVEYNRHGEDTKKLHDLIYDYGCPREREDTTVLPDVIVHRRGSDDSNLLIIEMKKSTSREGVENDRRRIRAFRQELGYKLGALVVCKTKGQCEISVEWYE